MILLYYGCIFITGIIIGIYMIGSIPTKTIPLGNGIIITTSSGDLGGKQE